MSDTLEAAIEGCAQRLFQARSDAVATAPVRHALPAGDLQAAYAVQAINRRRYEAAGARAVGRKIGLTSEAVQRQLGVDQPDFGVLLDFMDFGGAGAVAALDRLIAPRIEGEFAFRLGADLMGSDLPLDTIAAAIDGVAVAAEIVDSAVAGWDIDIVDTVADNASCGGFVVGPWRSYTADLDLPTRRMQLTRGDDIVSSGIGAATLGDPLNALAWLARTVATLGAPLRAGEIVLAGALGPMTDLKAGRYAVEVEGFDALPLLAAA